MASAIPRAVRDAALFQLSEAPEPPAELPVEKLTMLGCTLLVIPGPTGGYVEVRSLTGDVEHVLAHMRELFRSREKTRVAWWISERATPAGITGRLQELGLVPYQEPPFEPRFAAMVRVDPPAAGPTEIEARPVATFEEYKAAITVGDTAFEIDEDDRRAWEEHERTSFDLQLRGASPQRTFVALHDGEVVGAAGALLGAGYVNLLGGSVRADMRGRGVYRALVRARWDFAVERGTPALTVQAGAMSRPILERLGFEIVGWEDCLLDRLVPG